MRRKETSADELVKLALKNLGISQRYMEIEAKNVWQEVVGNLIASKTSKLEVYHGRMYVSFSSSVVKNEMLMVKDGLLRAINERLGEDVVKEIVIR